MQTANDIIHEDLDTLRTRTLAGELATMAGKSLLITGGAGFLGYYLVQAITHYNSAATGGSGKKIALTVFDNFSRNHQNHFNHELLRFFDDLLAHVDGIA